MEKWIHAIETICADPSQEDKFNDWYNHTHLPDTLSCPGFIAARRYVIKEPHFGRGKYLAVYEIETDDIRKTLDIRAQRREQEKKAAPPDAAGIPGLILHVWYDVFFRQIYELTTDGRPFKMGNWIDTVELLPTDPAKEQELNDVYNNIHLADALKTPGFLGASRYVAENPCQGRGKYLTMYQIETDDIDRTMDIAHEGIEHERSIGRALNQLVPDSYTVIWRDIIFQKIYELSR